MRFLLLKIVSVAAILLLLCLPFFPRKFKFSLASSGYTRSDRWKNICFVIETVILGSLLLCITPFIKNLLDWFFNLGFIRWLIDFVPGRFVYTVDVAVIIITNLIVCAIFLITKKNLRLILDAKIFKDSTSDTDNDKKSGKGKKNKKNKKAVVGSDRRSDKRLKQLRRDSVLVFGSSKKEEQVKNTVISDYKIEKKQPSNENGKKVRKDDFDDGLTFGEFIKHLWFKFIGLFYDKEENYEYVKPGTYRWAKELKNFVFLLSCIYLVLCIAMLVPVCFSLNELSGFYTVAQWFVNNTYMYPMLSIVFLYELLWFVDGEHKEPEEAEEVFISFVDNLQEEKKADLEKSRTLLLDKYGQSYSIKNFDSEVLGGQSAYNIADKKQAIQNMAKAIRANKKFVNGDYMQSIEYMFDGKHVLFDSALYSALGEYIIHYLFVTLSFGKRVLFVCKDKKEIENAASYLETGFRQVTNAPQILWRICTFEKLHKGEKPDILLLTPEQFLERSLYIDGKDFFEELVDVFVLDVDEILTSNNYYCLIMAKKLEKATTDYDSVHKIDADSSVAVKKRIRYSFFSNGYIQALGNSIRQFFNLEDAPLETFHSFGLASKTEVFVWHTGVNSTLYVDNGANQVALEMQIAKDVCNCGISNINLISDTTVYSSQLNEIPGLCLNSCDLSDNPTGYVIVADDAFNLPNAIYNYSRFSGRKAAVLHVISKPYLLRDYFTAKAENYTSHFELIGETMCEHAEAKKANIILLLCDAINGIEQSLFVKRATDLLGERLADSSAEDCSQCADINLETEKCVRMCYEVAFGEKASSTPQYTLKKNLTSDFESRIFVYLNDADRLFENLLEHTKTIRLEYINSQSVEYLPVFKDEMTQHFIPGQVLVCNNRAYTIKDMDIQSGVILLDDTGASVNVPMDYIQTRVYNISKATDTNRFGHDYRTKNSVVSHVGFTVYDADITVETTGYYSIEKAVQTVDLVKPNFAKYVNLAGNEALLSKIRRDINTKMLVVKLDIAAASDPHITYSLSVILHEFMKTLFPQQYRCISVCPIFDEDCEETFFADDTAIRDLYPRVITSFENKESDTEEAGCIKFAIIEDVQGGNGAVDALVDGNGIMITNLLHVVADYLAWLISPNGQNSKYLNFGYEQRPEIFNLEKLEEIVRQFRYDVERSELVRLYDENSCFFCHKPLENEQGQVLEDRRAICSNCLENSVCTFEELDSVLSSVIDAIEKSTSVADTLPKNVSIDFISTKELRERYGKASQKLPVACCNHATGCIYIEYGLPKSAAYGAVARMITELWQDCNITIDGSKIYNGQLDYVEIQVLDALRYKTEAELLSNYYTGNEGLEELRKALNESGSTDSFAYLLGSFGKKDGGESDDEGTDDDGISFIAERDPKSLPRFHYDRLSDEHKAIYDQVYNAIQNHAESTGALTGEITVKQCEDIVHKVVNDNPDIFWVAYSPAVVSSDSNGVVRNIIFKYVMNASEVKRRKKQIEKAVKPFLKGIKPSMSDYEVALNAHRNIVELIDYDSIGLDEQDRDPSADSKPDNLRSIYGVFVQKKAVCAGYAKAFQYLLNRLGIECAYVIGPCHSGGYHAWNLIKLEGEYYYVDVTFDDRSNTDYRKNKSSEVSYDYFCITTEELLKSRKIVNAEMYPECTATKCNYFRRSKMFFTGYDAQRVAKIIASTLNAGKKEVAFKLETAELMELFKNRLVTNGGAEDIVRSSSEIKNPVYPCTSYRNEDLNILHILFEDK